MCGVSPACGVCIAMMGVHGREASRRMYLSVSFFSLSLSLSFSGATGGGLDECAEDADDLVALVLVLNE